MFRNWTASISLRIGLLLAIVTAPTLLLALYMADSRRQQEMEHVRAEAQNLARVIALQQGQGLERARTQLAALTLDDDILIPAACSRKLRDLLKLDQNFHQIVVADAAGNAICSANPLLGNPRFGEEAHIRQAFTQGKPALSNVIPARENQKWTVVATQPIFMDGAPRAVLIADIDFNWTQTLLQGLRLPPNSIISMSDARGRIIARTPEPERFIGREFLEAESFRRSISTAPEGIADSAGLDGVARVVAYSRVPDSDLYIRVGISQAAALAAGNAALMIGLIAILATLLLTLALSWVSASRLVLQPLRQLAEAAASLGRGNWGVRTGLSHDGHVMGPLAAKMDDLATYGQSITRAFRTLSAGNRTLLREENEQALLDAMCKVAVEQGGYKLAMVNYLVHDEAKSVRPVAHYGANNGLLETMQLSWADTERGRGSVGTAIRSNAPCILQRLLSDPRFAPWREEAVNRGFGSVISLPLRIDSEVIGTFTLMAEQEDAFDEPEQVLLEEMAADLSFGIQVSRATIRQREAERLAEHALTHDGLTGLPNQIAFLKELPEAIAHVASLHNPLAVFVIHLPRLQEVFDGFGYDPGNSAIQQIASRLQNIAGLEKRLFRLTANEFGTYLTNQDAQAAAETAKHLVSIFHDPVHVPEAQIDFAASIGAAFYPGHGDDAESLLRRAAIAAREGVHKDAHFFIYRGATERENPARLAIAAEMRSAIQRRELQLHYQPKLNLSTGELAGAEALIRWSHPQRGFLPPVMFVPLAEETGLIRAMTGLVIETAIRQQHVWLEGGKSLPIAVNISAKNLYDPNFLDAYQAQIETWGVPPNLIEIELTESALVNDPETAKKVLYRLRQLGSKIYIDDFGTGYSSLNYLVALPVHALKIDRSFVQQMSKHPDAYSVVASIISMAHNLKLRVVAEGVETEEDAAMLRALGCDEAQGYLFSKPLPAAEFDISAHVRNPFFALQT